MGDKNPKKIMKKKKAAEKSPLQPDVLTETVSTKKSKKKY